MGDQQAILFIGGPLDGQIRAVPHFLPTFTAASGGIGLLVQTEVYELETLRTDPENDFLVYRHAPLSKREAMERLLTNYRPEIKQE
jgi:hypothetical protein